AFGLALLLVGAAASGPSGEARADRRERSRPILISNAPAPAATVWQLRFATVNGRLALLSAGADKLVRSWSIEQEPDGNEGMKVELREAGKINWNVYRENVGAIYAMDAAEDGQGTRLAFGGFGRKASQVNVLYAEDPNRAVSLIDSRKDNQSVKSLDLHYD